MGRLKETRVATADVVWSKGMGTSAFDLMRGPIKTHGIGAISVFLSVSVYCWICLSLTLFLILSLTQASRPPLLGPVVFDYFLLSAV